MSKSNKNSLSIVLKRFLEQYKEVRCICMSTTEGVELLAEFRSPPNNNEESKMISSYAQSYYISIEQSQRLGLGQTKHSITWISNSILLQILVESVVISLVLDEGANLGIVEEQLWTLHSVLKPFCSSVPNDS